MTKDKMVTTILNNIMENKVDSKKLLYDLARQRLESQTKKDLKATYFADEE